MVTLVQFRLLCRYGSQVMIFQIPILPSKLGLVRVSQNGLSNAQINITFIANRLRFLVIYGSLSSFLTYHLCLFKVRLNHFS